MHLCAWGRKFKSTENFCLMRNALLIALIAAFPGRNSTQEVSQIATVKAWIATQADSAVLPCDLRIKEGGSRVQKCQGHHR